MGCGAICGDNSNTAVQVPLAHQALITIIPQLQHQQALLNKQLFDSFIKSYYEQPQRFQLTVSPKLIKGEKAAPDIMLKWKIVLFGLDHKNSIYNTCLGIPQKQDLKDRSNSQVDETLLFHDSFPQIEKDLERTFSLPQSRKHQFENVLKRISNHFPKMGYTQGINFIIGYLIIIGYSEQDSFWMFVHIAINRRYLLLGLYEDGFPLSNSLTALFTNILKRKNKTLHDHLFEDLAIDPSMWVFKWFMTCFLYSFPIELITYIWDMLINVGSIGIMAFAVSLVLHLAPKIITIHDIADLSDFLSSLKEIQIFNQNVNLSLVNKAAYELDLVYADFQGIQKVGSFYGQMVKQQFGMKQKIIQDIKVLPKNFLTSTKNDNILKNWYNCLIEDRVNFKFSTQQNYKKIDELPLEINSAPKYQSVSHQQEANGVILHILQPKSNNSFSINFEEITKDSTQLPQQQRQGIPRSMKRRSVIQLKNKKTLTIDEICQICEGNSSQSEGLQSAVSRSIHLNPHVQELDQLDRLSMQFDKPKNTYQKNNSKQLMVPKKITKIKTDDPAPTQKYNPMYLAGKAILKQQSCDAISISSKHSKQTISSKPRRLKNSSPSARICGCKTKTEQNNLPIRMNPRSSYESSSEQFSDTNSIIASNKVHHQESYDNRSVNHIENEYKNGKNVNYMINSHGPAIHQNNQIVQSKQLSGQIKGEAISRQESQIEKVQVFPFKKSKIGKNSRISHIEISKKNNKEKELCAVCQERSIESLYQDPPDKFPSHPNRYSCQIESTC